MRRIYVNSNVTLDGVMQAPGRPDEDTRGGFEYGGWAGPYFDPVMAESAGEGMAGGGALLFGRRTYATSPPCGRTCDDNPFASFLNESEKFVASRSLEEPFPWAHSTLLEGDAVESVARLKDSDGPDLLILGSGELI